MLALCKCSLYLKYLCCTHSYVMTIFFLIPVNQIPLPLDKISSVNHPVKVGLSDAFMLNNTVYEYHRLEINTTEITSYSAVEFIALPSQ